MKILFFSPYYLPYISGITTYPSTLFHKLSQKHDITVLCFRHQKELKSHETIDEVEVIRMPYLFKISKGYISPQSIWYFFQQARQSDIVFLNIPNFEGLFLALIAKLLGKKILSIFHCEVILGNSVWEKIISSILNTSVYVQLMMSDSIVGYTQDYVTSRSISKNFLSKFRFVYPPVQLLPVDKEQIKKTLYQKNKSIWVGYAGRIAREKGITYLIDAARILKEKGMNIKLIFAGPYGKQVAGEEKYYSEVITLLKNTEIRYEFLGSLREKELSTFYSTIDILVLPSVNQTEAFGQVQVDAMMLGTPVITTNLPGVRVPVRETKMGIIISSEDSLKLARAIREVVKNKSTYTNSILVQHARKIFDINKTYEFYDTLLQ